MKFQVGFAAAALTGALLLAGPALATDLSINTAAYSYASWNAAGGSIANNIGVLSGDGVTNNDVAFWTATTTFNLADINQTLSISDLASDDRVVVLLNGTAIAAAGIFLNNNPNGTFIFTPGGSQVAQLFSPNGAQTVSVNAPFLLGANTLKLIVNNTNNGINGGFTQGPSSLFLTANVGPTGVPEPATWGLMLVGFGGLGAMVRQRRAARALAA
jgi:hypothetical protein